MTPLDAYRLVLKRQVWKETRAKVNAAIDQGKSRIEVKVYGMERQVAYQECGWEPSTEKELEGRSYTEMTMIRDIPSMKLDRHAP